MKKAQPDNSILQSSEIVLYKGQAAGLIQVRLVPVPGGYLHAVRAEPANPSYATSDRVIIEDYESASEHPALGKAIESARRYLEQCAQFAEREAEIKKQRRKKKQ